MERGHIAVVRITHVGSNSVLGRPIGEHWLPITDHVLWHGYSDHRPQLLLQVLNVVVVLVGVHPS